MVFDINIVAIQSSASHFCLFHNGLDDTVYPRNYWLIRGSNVASPNRYEVGFNTGAPGSGYIVTNITFTTGRQTIDVSNISGNMYLKINNVSQWTSTTTNVGTGGLSTIYLFGNPLNSIPVIANIIVYNVQVYNASGSKIRDLYPARKKIDTSTIGLYDTITSNFYKANNWSAND